MTEAFVAVSAKDNPLLVKLRKLARDPSAYRKQGELWLEGEHLCAALRVRGLRPTQAVLAESAWSQPALRQLAHWAPRVLTTPRIWSGIDRDLLFSLGFPFEFSPA